MTEFTIVENTRSDVRPDDKVSRARELELRILQLEESKARLERERLEYELMGEELVGELSEADVAEFHRYLDNRQQHAELLRDGRIVPIHEVPPLAILDLAELTYWRHALAEATGLQTFLFLMTDGVPLSTANSPAQLSVLAECEPACRSAVEEAVVGMSRDVDRPVGVRCKGCGRPLWVVPVNLCHKDNSTAIAFLAGHSLPSPTRSYRQMVELVANQVGRRASEEYGNQINTILQMQMSAMIDRYMQQRTAATRDAEAALRQQTASAIELTRAKDELEIALCEAGKTRIAAEEANSSKSMYLAAMSHEIRTPLTCVIGFADLLAMPSLTIEEAHKFAGSIKESGQVLLSLINNILDLSKIEAGCLDLERIPYSLRQALVEVVNIFEPSSREMKVDIHVRVAGDVPPEQLGDPMRLRQVLLNLVGNALKFTREGRIDLICCLSAADPTVLEVSVKDTGTGIPQHRLDAIFEAFQQAETKTSRKYGGTGLGLAISRRIIEVMGGRLSVSSREGEGSCFTFSLPGQMASEPVEPVS